MKKAIFKAKTSIESQKKLYIFLIGLAVLGIISGIIFIFLISDENIVQIKDNLTLFFKDINTGNKLDLLFSSLINNLVYVLSIWTLGISIIGLPIIITIFSFKFFFFGFSLSSIICTYKWGGILRSLVHLFPHQLLFLIVLLLVTFYAVSFCLKLFNYLFFKKMINFREVMRKYLKILLICSLTTIFISLYEVYISTYLLNLFN